MPHARKHSLEQSTLQIQGILFLLTSLGAFYYYSLFSFKLLCYCFIGILKTFHYEKFQIYSERDSLYLGKKVFLYIWFFWTNMLVTICKLASQQCLIVQGTVWNHTWGPDNPVHPLTFLKPWDCKYSSLMSSGASSWPAFQLATVWREKVVLQSKWLFAWETWEWLAGVRRELRCLWSPLQPATPQDTVTLGDSHPFPCLGVKVLVGKVGRWGVGVKDEWACFCLLWSRAPVCNSGFLTRSSFSHF